MTFYLIENIDDKVLVGVLIESKEGVVHARLAGDEGTDDSARILPSLLRRMPKHGFPVEKKRGTGRVISFVRPGQTGFVNAWLSLLRPPLRLQAWGTAGTTPRGESLGAPDAITADIWRAFGKGSEMPEHKLLPLS
jgi:hypothetical protein